MSITDIFNSLNLSDGSPDFIHRRIQLDNLITHLTSSEIRHLRTKLDDIQSNQKGNDSFDKIPLELCLKIINGIYLDDLLRIRLICQSWRQKFSNPSFCIHLLKKYFHLPWERCLKRLKSECSEVEDQDIKKWAQRSIIGRIRREHGISSVHYHIELPEPTLSIRYSDGRIAYQMCGKIVVQDLVTKRKRCFTTPDRINMLKWYLFDQLLIGTVRGPTELLVFDLISSETHSIRLPASVFSLSAHKNQVGIVTGAFKSFIWAVGDALKSLVDVKSTVDSSEQIMAAHIFFDTKNEENVLIVHHSRIISGLNPHYATKITVQCFKARTQICTQHIIHYTPTKPQRYHSSMISNDGIIGIEVGENPYTVKNHESFYKHLTYDMNTKKFEILEVNLHPSIKRNLLMRPNLIWRDQIFHPIQSRYGNKCELLQVITLSKSLIDVWNGLSKIVDGPSHSSLQSSILCGEIRSDCANTVMGTEIYDIFSDHIGIWGDDEFVVMNVGDKLTIWQFDNPSPVSCSFFK